MAMVDKRSIFKGFLEKKYGVEEIRSEKNFDNLSRIYSRLPDGLKPIVVLRYQHLLGEQYRRWQVEELYAREEVEELKLFVEKRYGEMLANDLRGEKITFDELRSIYIRCPDKFRLLVMARYGEMLQKCFSFDELDSEKMNCPQGLQQLLLDRYKELLPGYPCPDLTFDEIRTLWKKVQGIPKTLVAERYLEILETYLSAVDSMEILYSLNGECPKGGGKLIKNRFVQLLSAHLSGVESQEDLEKSFEECPYDLREIFQKMCESLAF